MATFIDKRENEELDEEEKIHYEMIARTIHELITVSRFKIFNEVDELGKCNKLRKTDINEVYGYIIGYMQSKWIRIDIFSEMCIYFDIRPVKFYSSLSNVYKEDLIQELDRKTGILEKKNIKKLF